MRLSINSKKEILKIIIESRTDFLSENETRYSEGTFDFLNKIWNLKEMPSTDSRYTNAEGDIYQHMINNNDWDFYYLFVEILKVYDDDEKFITLIHTFLLPEYRKDEDEIIAYVVEFNLKLEADKLKLSIYDYANGGIPIYHIYPLEEVDNIPIEIKKNSIPFVVFKLGEKNNINSIKHSEFFLLRENYWDDYSSRTTFYLYYIKDSFTNVIGEIKIMVKDIAETIEVIPLQFYSLANDFCSLGQKEEFYKRLKDFFPNNFEDILFALCDCAFFSTKLEDFEKNHRFKNSLIRYDYAERTLRLIKYQLLNYDLNNLFHFEYNFTPKYSKESVNISFKFDNNKILANRIYAIIGKNGTGKTQLLTSLPLNIAQNNSSFFSPRVPLFSKMISVSYSIFDRFKIPLKTSKFNYVYCGLKNEKGKYISEQGLLLRFHYTWKKIESLERINKWRTILLNFIEEDIVNSFLIKKESITSFNNQYRVDIDGFNKVKDYLSSGQNILLYIITEITANIRFDSLILYDEPETHLHPNAISQLINTIYELVDEFQSYCIIGTHSPLIIQELLSKNVYVMERNGNTPDIRRIGIESFGENLNTLTDDVFGNREIQKQYKRIIDEQIENGKKYDEILDLIQFDNSPLSLNARLYIKSKLKS
ncbi:AbiJ-related protein [Flavobacterium defluvii]|uniref:AAA ATPase domain-containing protein n=1 Tax=Flavobacterium defluvii TaxID=370979 RepID=A0A1M5GD43_9FLAO|nr:AAA family ATPase [Flavobacterium defluvii]SHG01653.1 AAA ATPase domain-containing protein [Flavobacterium defluvii]